MYIETKALRKAYKGREVVKGISVRVDQGSVVGLLGPNGAGKTTTFYMIVGLVTPDAGEVIIDGTDVTRMPMYRRSQFGIGYLPQEPSVFRKLTVEENLRAMLEITNLTRTQQREKIESLLEEFRITHVRGRKGIELSGGERRRVEIARALVTDPNFLLLDEPFTGIDPISLGELQGMIGYLSKRGIGVLITDHNVRETLAIVDNAYIVNEGEVLISGNSQTIIDSEIARKFYLGDNFYL
jgi:lipopolysaccharide export system ATP-binding protein